MRQITKIEPEFFTSFIAKEKPDEWGNMAPISERLRKHMLEHEQNGQCAYTEISIDATNAQSHIDHFKRKHSSLFPQLTFTYSNLFTAHKAESYGAKYKDKQVKTTDDYNKLLSPLTKELSSFFSFDVATGEIKGITEEAEYTKDMFNLNHPTLLERRVTAINNTLAYINQFPVEETIQYIGEFESLIRYIYAVNNN